VIQFHQHGYLFLAGEDKVPVMEKNNKNQRSCGASWIELMEVEKLKQKFPWLNTDNIAMGSFGHENEGYFDPWSLLTALKVKAISQGVDYIDGEVISAKVNKVANDQLRVESLEYRAGSISGDMEELVVGTVVNVSCRWLYLSIGCDFQFNLLLDLWAMGRKIY
jgi:glycine/D-amino acid oxidase-like deaminating enzyme